MGCVGRVLRLAYVGGLLLAVVIAMASRHGSPFLVLGIGVAIYYAIDRMAELLFPPSDSREAGQGRAVRPEDLARLRRLGTIRDRIYRAGLRGRIDPYRVEHLVSRITETEAQFWRLTAREGQDPSLGVDRDPEAIRFLVERWGKEGFATQEECELLAPGAGQAPITRLHPRTGSEAPAAVPTPHPPQGPESSPATGTAAPATDAEASGAARRFRVRGPEDSIVAEIERPPDAGQSEAPAPAGREVRRDESSVLWIPDAPDHAVGTGPEGAAPGIEGEVEASAEILFLSERHTLPAVEPEPPQPSLFDLIKANFVEEGNVRWAEALFALFTVLAFVTGVAVLGYTWGRWNPYLRFGALAAVAGLFSLGAGRVAALRGLQETGRTLGIVAFLAAPITMGALPFLVGPEASLVAFLAALSGAFAWFLLILEGTRGLCLGAASPRYLEAYLAGGVLAAVVPRILVGSELRGILALGVGAAWLAWLGSRTGPGDRWAGDRLLRMLMPLHLVAVGTAAAAAVAPLETGMWCFSAALAGYLLYAAALEEGAGGPTFPSLPMGLQAAAFGVLGCAILVSAGAGGFWGNRWLVETLLAAFATSCLGAVRRGSERPAYLSVVFLTGVSVLVAGPEVGRHSTLMLLPFGAAIAGAVLLGSRVPGAARAWSRSAHVLLVWVLAQGIRDPREGLVSSVLLLSGSLPMALALRDRVAAAAAIGSAALATGFAIPVVWLLPARDLAGLVHLGPVGGWIAAAPFLALLAAVLAGLDRVLGPGLEARLGTPRGMVEGRGLPAWLRSTGPFSAWVLPLALASLPGLVLALMAAFSWVPIHPDRVPGAIGIPGPFFQGLGAILATLACLGSGYRDHRFARYPIPAGPVLAGGHLGAVFLGPGGAALGLALGTWSVAEAAAWVGVDRPGGDPRTSPTDPLPLVALAGSGLGFLLFGLPLFLGGEGGRLAALALIVLAIALTRLGRSFPFAWHLHLAPGLGLLAVYAGCEGMLWSWRLVVLAWASFGLALVGTTGVWKEFSAREAAAGGGPASHGWLPSVDVPLLGLVAVGIGLGEPAGEALGRAAWAVVAGLVSPPLLVQMSTVPQAGWALIAASGVAFLGHAGYGWSAWTGGLVAAVGTLAATDRILDLLPGRGHPLAPLLVATLAVWAWIGIAARLDRRAGGEHPLGPSLRRAAALVLGLPSAASLVWVASEAGRTRVDPGGWGRVVALLALAGGAEAWRRLSERPGRGYLAWPMGATLLFTSYALARGIAVTWWSAPALVPEDQVGFLLGFFVVFPFLFTSAGLVASHPENRGAWGAFGLLAASLAPALLRAWVGVHGMAAWSGATLVLAILTTTVAIGAGLTRIGVVTGMATGLAGLTLGVPLVRGVAALTAPVPVDALPGFSQLGFTLLAELVGEPCRAGVLVAAPAAMVFAMVMVANAPASWVRILGGDPGEGDGERAPRLPDLEGVLEMFRTAGVAALLLCLLPPLEERVVSLVAGWRPWASAGNDLLLALALVVAGSGLLHRRGSRLAGEVAGAGLVLGAVQLATIVAGGGTGRAPGALAAWAALVVTGALARRGLAVADGYRIGELGTLMVLGETARAAVGQGADGYAALAAGAPVGAALHLFELAVRTGREDLVYAGQVAAACSFFYLRATGILGVTFWGQIALQVVAFGLLWVGHSVQTNEWSVLGRPFRRVGLVLPAFLMLRILLEPGTPIDWKGWNGSGQFLLGAMAAAFYALAAQLEGKAACRYLAGLCGWLGWAMFLAKGGGYDDPWRHLDLYLVPLGMLVVLFSRLERANLLVEQEKAMRTVGLLLVYVSPAVHAVWGATRGETLVLIGLGVVGVVAGILAGVDMFLAYGMVAILTGSASYLLNIYRMELLSFAFLVFALLAAGFGFYSFQARSERADLGLSGRDPPGD